MASPVRELPSSWRPGPELPDQDPWDTAYSLLLIAAVLYGLALGFGLEVLWARR